jgi:hypothetical protein
LGAGINHQLHGIILVGEDGHGVLQGILNTAIPAAITERASPVAPGINFNLHSISILRNEIMGKGRGGGLLPC